MRILKPSSHEFLECWICSLSWSAETLVDRAGAHGVVLHVRLSPDDLAVLAVATRSPSKLARIVVGAMLAGHEVDFVIERDAKDFVAVGFEVRGDAIVREHVLRIVWGALDERTRCRVLGVYIQQVLLGVAMTKKRALAFRKIAAKEIT